MRVPWPSEAEVQATDSYADTLKLLRWKNHLPAPTTAEEEAVAMAVVQKLAQVNRDHVETIANATGYVA